MWIAALVGKMLQVFRVPAGGEISCGSRGWTHYRRPLLLYRNGMGKSWKWLAKIFAFYGCMRRIVRYRNLLPRSTVSPVAVHNFFDANNAHTVQLFGMDYSWSVVISGILLTICVALVVIGGLKRISTVAQVIVPFMAVTYVVACLLVLIFNVTAIPAAIVTILQSAFGMRAVAGGALGAVIMAMQKGIARGYFLQRSRYR